MCDAGPDKFKSVDSGVSKSWKYIQLHCVLGRDSHPDHLRAHKHTATALACLASSLIVPDRVVRFRVPVVRIFDPDFADLFMSARFVGIFNDQMLLMIGSQ